jgi:hypothetical protein
VIFFVKKKASAVCKEQVIGERGTFRVEVQQQA